ncbi:MAG TPA: hypothetical protein VJ964_09910 [Balneolaceae bacterium]|nr:hypothetical protein [Balneolaceae bacterium]
MNRTKYNTTFWAFIGLILLANVNASAQSSTNNYKFGNTHFALLGEFGYGANITNNSTTFISPDLGLMPLYQQGNFFFESGFGANFENPNQPIMIGPINVSYKLPSGILIRAGHFDALPLGRFPRDFDPGWINPMAVGPKGFDNFGDFSDFGVEVQGAGYINDMQLRTYFSITNGAALSTSPGSAGLLEESSLDDNNKSKMIGGRVSLSPFFSSNFEFGISDYYSSNVGDSGSNYDGIGANLMAIDANVAPTIQSLNGFIRVRGQINFVHVDKATYMDSIGNPYSFTNNSTAWYGLVAYQPSMASSQLLSNLMYSFMLSHASVPKGALWSDIGTGTKYDVGLTYWFNWRTNLKLNYDINENAENALNIRIGLQL